MDKGSTCKPQHASPPTRHFLQAGSQDLDREPDTPCNALLRDAKHAYRWRARDRAIACGYEFCWMESPADRAGAARGHRKMRSPPGFGPLAARRRAHRAR